MTTTVNHIKKEVLTTTEKSRCQKSIVFLRQLTLNALFLLPAELYWIKYLFPSKRTIKRKGNKNESNTSPVGNPQSCRYRLIYRHIKRGILSEVIVYNRV